MTMSSVCGHRERGPPSAWIDLFKHSSSLLETYLKAKVYIGTKLFGKIKQLRVGTEVWFLVYMINYYDAAGGSVLVSHVQNLQSKLCLFCLIETGKSCSSLFFKELDN